MMLMLLQRHRIIMSNGNCKRVTLEKTGVGFWWLTCNTNIYLQLVIDMYGTMVIRYG